MMYGPEKSDSAIVAGKPTNKAEWSATELVERRAGTKGGQFSTRRTQSRISVTQALARIRQSSAVDTLVAQHSDFDWLGQAVRLTPAEFWDQRGVRYCALSLATF